MADAMPLVVLVNRGSGSGDALAVERAIGATLSAAGREVQLLRVRRAGEVLALAREAADRAEALDGAVVVAGGDGTLNAAVQAVLPRALPLGVLPQGTFNFFGRCHGLPLGDPAAAARYLLSARETPVQVGEVNGRLFLVNASLGLYPRLLERREQDKQRFGRRRLVALASGLGMLLRRHPRLDLTVLQDGERRVLSSSTLVVGNNRLQLEQLGIAEAAAVERGALAGIAVRPVPRWRMLALGARGLLGRLGDADHVSTFAFGEMAVDIPGRRRIKLALDGEIVHAELPLRFALAARPLRLLVPADGAGG